MKKLLALALAALMLATCGCTSPADGTVAEDAYAADIMDNTDLIPLAVATHDEVRTNPSDKAYVRSGKYGNMTWRDINRELKLDTNNEEPLGLKNNGKNAGDNTREVLLEFDLTEIAKFNFKNVFWVPSWISAPDTNYCVDIYLLDHDAWDGETVTYNTKPAYKTLIADNAIAGGLSAVNLTDAVLDVIAKGDNVLSIAIVGSEVSTGNYSINPKTTALVATTADEANNYVYDLVEDEAENEAIWNYAQKLFNEWLERYLELRNQPLNEDAPLIVSDEDEFNKTVYSGDSGFGNWTLSNVNKPHAPVLMRHWTIWATIPIMRTIMSRMCTAAG